MAKTTGGKKKEEKKNPFKLVKDLITGGEKGPSTTQIADKNRKLGEAIASVLDVVDFSRLKNAEGMTEEKFNEMRASVKASSIKLQKAPTIVDDISELDTILLNAAETLKTAADFGYVNQAEWCINAISTGLLLLRDNVPPQRQDARDELIKKRVEYMKKYKDLITLYGAIDETTSAINQGNAALKKYEEEYAPKKQEVQEIRKDEEKSKILASIMANENQPGNLSDEARNMLFLLIETGNLASRVVLLRDLQFTRALDNEEKLSMAKDYRAALVDQPKLYDQDLSGEYAVLLGQVNESISKTLAAAAAIRRIAKDAENQRKQIMNDPALQEIVDDALAAEKQISEVKKIPSKDKAALEDLKRQTEQWNRQKQENVNTQKAMDHLVQESVDTAIDFNKSENELTDTDTNTNEQTDTNDLTEGNYNLNS